MPAAVTIDLGSVADGPAEELGPPRPSPGLLALLLALLVTVTVTGSAPLRSGAWAAGSVPITAADDFAVVGDLLVVASAGHPDRGESVVTAYRLPLLNVVWRLTLPASVGHSLSSVGDSLLVGSTNGVGRQIATVVVAAATGTVRWRRDGRLIPVPGRPVLLAVTDVPSVSATDRRIQGTVSGVDPGTGAIRWTVRLRSTAVAQPLPTGEFLLVHDSGVAELRDPATAAIRVSGTLPPASYAPDNPRLIGETVVLRHPGDNTTRISGYDVRTFDRRWTRPVGGLQAVDPCGELICLGTTIGVRAIEPVSGANRWVSQSWRRALGWAGTTVAYGRPTGRDADLAVVDPMTGESRLDLSAWELVTGVSDDVVLTHPDPHGGDTLVATVDSDRPAVHVRGRIPPTAGGCRSGGGVLACRVGGDMVGVWVLAGRD